ncbi:DNA cytosine methyltransferase [Amylibacter sp.]|nr:DNA cytosine methyltransferase [Amylibacter sp.]
MSLFSGAGGFDLGLIQAGHEVIWANDFDSDCVETYKNNIGQHVLFSAIENIPSSEIPKSDCVVGGFPCQGFSQANRLRFGEDPRNRLYLEFLRVVRDTQPKWFLAENVRGILSLDNGAAIKKIEKDFSKVGYHIETKLFNTADFGVPQKRWRVIIAGTRKDLPETSGYIHPTPTHNKLGSDGLKKWISIGDALSEIPEPTGILPDKFPNHIFSKYKVTNRNFTGHRTTNPDQPSPTILARGNGGGGVCALQHPKNHRRMSIREQAVVQTFPLTFEFCGSMNSCYRQVGNAVPVLFGKHIGKRLSMVEKLLEVVS